MIYKAMVQLATNKGTVKNFCLFLLCFVTKYTPKHMMTKGKIT